MIRGIFKMKENLESKVALTNARDSFIRTVRDVDPKVSQYLKTYTDASDRHYKAPIGFGQVAKKYAAKGIGWGS